MTYDREEGRSKAAPPAKDRCRADENLKTGRDQCNDEEDEVEFADGVVCAQTIIELFWECILDSSSVKTPHLYRVEPEVCLFV